MNAYRYLAQAYNNLMSDVDYDAWASYINSLLGQKELRLFEASCGTGSITARLYDMGHNVIASDISPEMLDIAMCDARLHGRNIVFIQQDMRRLSAGKPMDAVVSACDGANYLDQTGLKEFFSSAFTILKPGGKFLFDISSAHKLRSMDGQVYYDDSDDATCIWSNHYNKAENKLLMDVVLFLREGDAFKKMCERHIQFAHDPVDIQKALSDIGFRHIEAYEAFTTDPAKSDSHRIQFACRKD